MKSSSSAMNPWCLASSLAISSRMAPGWRIPKGFRLKTQGCEARATLGVGIPVPTNPNGVAAQRQGTRDTTPLGLGMFSTVDPG